MPERRHYSPRPIPMDKEFKRVLNEPKEVFEILEELVKAGKAQHLRPSRSLFLSAFSAGLEISFSILLMGVVYTLFHGMVSHSFLRILLAMAYPIGFVFVVIGRSELFTEHTTLAILPVLRRSQKWPGLLRLWGIVLSGNLLGGFVFSVILATLPVGMKIIDLSTYEALALQIVRFHWSYLLGSATLAGWLMGLLAWLVTSSQETISRIFIIVLITFVIGVAGLHHSVVGSVEVFTGMLSGKEINFGDYLFFEWWSVLGNIIGGSVFVSVLKYSHTRREDQTAV